MHARHHRFCLGAYRTFNFGHINVVRAQLDVNKNGDNRFAILDLQWWKPAATEITSSLAE